MVGNKTTQTSEESTGINIRYKCYFPPDICNLSTILLMPFDFVSSLVPFDFPIIWLWEYLMKVIPETRHDTEILYLRFSFSTDIFLFRGGHTWINLQSQRMIHV
jgi:hypothetical protein